MFMCEKAHVAQLLPMPVFSHISTNIPCHLISFCTLTFLFGKPLTSCSYQDHSHISLDLRAFQTNTVFRLSQSLAFIKLHFSCPTSYLPLNSCCLTHQIWSVLRTDCIFYNHAFRAWKENQLSTTTMDKAGFYILSTFRPGHHSLCIY